MEQLGKFKLDIFQFSIDDLLYTLPNSNFPLIFLRVFSFFSCRQFSWENDFCKYKKKRSLQYKSLVIQSKSKGTKKKTVLCTPFSLYSTPMDTKKSRPFSEFSHSVFSSVLKKKVPKLNRTTTFPTFSMHIKKVF